MARSIKVELADDVRVTLIHGQTGQPITDGWLEAGTEVTIEPPLCPEQEVTYFLVDGPGGGYYRYRSRTAEVRKVIARSQAGGK